MADLPGVDLLALSSWLDDVRPGLRGGELSGEVIAGGKSNLTYRITDGEHQWALRRPPLAHVLPTAHDMKREYTVISALQPTAVPVADAIALCEDEGVLGAKFYLMGFVDGAALDQDEDLADLTPEQAAHCGELLADTLADLHDIDPVSVGLGEFGRPEGFLARQVKRWNQQWDASETRALDELGQLVEQLTRRLPEQSAPGIVHGDYRLTNVMYTADLERIAAVVDWEMATLGDPLTDVGLLVVYHDLAADENTVMPTMSSQAGFLTSDELVERYARRVDRDVTSLDWYVAFGYFKLAVISEGIHKRYLAGKTVGEGFDHFGRSVPPLLHQALDRLAGKGTS